MLRIFKLNVGKLFWDSKLKTPLNRRFCEIFIKSLCD
jgi:hypothetical protein